MKLVPTDLDLDPHISLPVKYLYVFFTYLEVRSVTM